MQNPKPAALEPERDPASEKRSERDPDSVAPIAAALVMAPPVVIVVVVPIAMEIPAVGVNLDLDAVLVVIVPVGVPAIALVIADDFGRCRSSRKCNCAKA